jgi:hypothetical protein
MCFASWCALIPISRLLGSNEPIVPTNGVIGNSTEVSENVTLRALQDYFRIAGNTSGPPSHQNLGECIGDYACADGASGKQPYSKRADESRGCSRMDMQEEE